MLLVALLSLITATTPVSATPVFSNPVETVEIHGIELHETGKSETVELRVPDDAIGVQIRISGPKKASYSLTQITAPDGTRWGQSDQITYPQFNGVGQALFPNTPEKTLTPGIWHFKISSEKESPDGERIAVKGFAAKLQLRATFQIRPKKIVGAKIPVRVYVTPNRYINAKKLKATTEFWQDLSRPFEAIGITVDVESVKDLRAALPPRKYQSLPEIARLVEPFRGVSLFLVDPAYINGAPGLAIGSSSGTDRKHPGAVFMRASWPLKSYGIVAAHEMGHMLGLFHPVENGIALPGLLGQPQQYSDIMEHFVAGEAQFSPHQSTVLHRHPCVHLLTPTQP